VQVHAYAGLRNAGPRTLLRHPGRVARAEASLRMLAAARSTRLLVHREASPLSRGHLESALARSATVSVYDFDDALYLDTGTGPFYRRLAPKATKVARVLRTVDRVVAGNDTLANWAADHHRDVVVIPSCVDTSAYRPKADYAVGSPPRIGWIGSSSSEVHLASISSALLALHDRLGARLVVLGSPAGHLGRLERMVDRIPWSLPSQRDETARFDVGIMPLLDTPYARGKCGYKLLQYLAAGVPSVASPVGVNTEILRLAGMPAVQDPKEWEESITALLEASTDRRRTLGTRGRDVVTEHYSFSAWLDRWRAAVFLGV
jgi:glycosyltransferase involved in cell wall biosynthesis